MSVRVSRRDGMHTRGSLTSDNGRNLGFHQPWSTCSNNTLIRLAWAESRNITEEKI